MKHIFLIFLMSFIFSFQVSAEEKVFNLKQVTTFMMKPEKGSPIIYPLELGYEMIVEKKDGDWINVKDKKTGLKGWVLNEDFGIKKPEEVTYSKDYDKSFEIFKGKVMEMNNSIKEALGINIFLDVIHLGGVSAVVIAEDDWFNGRRHQGQAFQVYDLWKQQNQAPSFLSFKDKDNNERFIILSGPHRPRYLKSSN